jgi:predicted N-acyltransferase
LQILDGHSATENHWALFTAFYNRTFETKWGMPTLNQAFFQAVADALPDQVVLVLAHLGRQTLAGALLFRSQTVLYGRHWGCLEEIDSLHFEACYYQGIEYAITHSLAVFEPGAQGEHKLARGFVPTLTRSAHWLSDSRFHPAIRQFCQDERDAVEDYMRQLDDHSPFHQGKSA